MDILRPLKAHLSKTAHSNTAIIWAIACPAFFGFFRLGELLLSAGVQWEPKLHLSWGDIAIDNHDSPSLVQVHLKQSKCDQFGKGVKVTTLLGRQIMIYVRFKPSQPTLLSAQTSQDHFLLTVRTRLLQSNGLQSS